MVCIWPCGTRCFYEELEEYLVFMSDDFMVVEVDEEEEHSGIYT